MSDFLLLVALLAQILELRVDDLALLGAGRAARPLPARRLLTRLGLLRLAVHDLGQLVRGLGEVVLRALDALDVLTLALFLGLAHRLLDGLAVSLAELGAVLAERALRRVHERVGLIARLDLGLALGVLGGV